MSGPPSCPVCLTELPGGASFCPRCGRERGAGPLAFGDYEVTGVIGQGGMGRVYRAVQRRLNRAVCIKTLLPELATDAVASRRFQQEATSTASLAHPNIVSIFDVGTAADGTAYLVMELIDGRTLRAILRDEAPVPVARAVRLIDQVLSALAEAHTHGIVHRDLKPGNVLVVSLRDGTELCKVLDFGIARVLDPHHDEDRLTRAGTVLGTVGYMAPEQLLGAEVDHRVDLYAAGVLFHELITGQRVFRAASSEELARKTVLTDPSPPSSRVSQPISRGIDQVCLKALARPAEARYANATEFREALAQAMLGDGEGAAVTPNLRCRVDCTPLASLANPAAPPARSDLRALLAGVLEATNPWDRAQLLSAFEAGMREELEEGRFEGVLAAITALQGEQREGRPGEALPALVETTRGLILELLPLLLGWLADEERGRAATWLLRLPGRSAIGTYLRELPALEVDTQRRLLRVVHAMDPDGSALVPLLRSLEPAVLRPLLIDARAWHEDQSFVLFSAVLQSTSAPVRQLTLELLDERNAFRLSPLVRTRLHDPAHAVRSAALRWVSRLEDEGAIDDLESLLGRSSILPPERRAICLALCRLKTERAFQVLANALGNVREVEQAAELSALLVGCRSPVALAHVRALARRPSLQPQLKRVLDQALRQA